MAEIVDIKAVVAQKLKDISRGDRVTSNEAQWLMKGADLLVQDMAPLTSEQKLEVIRRIASGE